MPTGTKILVASDHAGLEMKTKLISGLTDWKWIDLGPMDLTSVDYSDYAQSLAEKIQKGEASEGVLICGSGIGMSIAANKFPGIRAALVSDPISARLAREHNQANVLCLGSRFTASAYGVEIVKAWLLASFSENPRHIKRIQKIQEIETDNHPHNSNKKSTKR